MRHVTPLAQRLEGQCRRGATITLATTGEPRYGLMGLQGSHSLETPTGRCELQVAECMAGRVGN
jgi:hypothetical protein